jgi:hypothetical protein
MQRSKLVGVRILSMKSAKHIAVCSVLGGLLSFCVWPVLSAAPTNNFACGHTADCPSVVEHTYRLNYLIHKESYNKRWAESGWKSNDEYCSRAACMQEAVAIPLSIVVGLLVGGTIGVIYTKLFNRSS